MENQENWAKEFDAIKQCGAECGFSCGGACPDKVKSFIQQLLSSHSQALQERHEAEIKRRREAMDYSGPQYTTQEVSEMGEEEKLRALSFNSGIQTAIAAFDHATHLNPKS